VTYTEALTAHRQAAAARLAAAADTARGPSNAAEAVELARAQMHHDVDAAATAQLAQMPPPRRPILRTPTYRTTGQDPA
jgi:hypothetical protein